MLLCKISVAFLRKTVYYILLDYYRGVCPDVTTSRQDSPYPFAVRHSSTGAYGMRPYGLYIQIQVKE